MKETLRKVTDSELSFEELPVEEFHVIRFLSASKVNKRGESQQTRRKSVQDSVIEFRFSQQRKQKTLRCDKENVNKKSK